MAVTRYQDVCCPRLPWLEFAPRGISIDRLTEEQEEYLSAGDEGT